jgi:hypothetical protein
MAGLQLPGTAMKPITGIQSLLLIIGLQFASFASAHPENSPLTFIPHKTDDGWIIYTNIPKRCFSKGVLTCADLHPIHGGNKRKATSSTLVKKQSTEIEIAPSKPIRR